MLTYDNSAKAEEDYQKYADIDSQKGFIAFLSHLKVDSQPVKKPFFEIAEPWQWDRAHRTAPALDQLAGIAPDGTYEGPLSFWNGYAKGHNKTHFAGWEILFLLAYSKRRLLLYVCAGDGDQAALVTLAMQGTCKDNLWLDKRVKVTGMGAEGDSGSVLTILTADAATNQGIFPDYVDAEEVTHWEHAQGGKLWNFILSSMNKRPSCVLVVNTNAGYKDTWQYEERNRTEVSTHWNFYEQPVGTQLASWMNQAKIEDDSQGMEPGERDRLYKNRWIDPGEESGYLTLAEAESCVNPQLTEQTRGDARISYYAIIDYGGTAKKNADRCALCVLHNVPSNRGSLQTKCFDELRKARCPEPLFAKFWPFKDVVLETHDLERQLFYRLADQSERQWLSFALSFVVPAPDRVVVDRMDCWMGNCENPVIIDMIPGHPEARTVEGWIELTRQSFRLKALIVDKYQLESLSQRMERRNVRVVRFEYRGGKVNYQMAQVLKNAIKNHLVSWSPEAGRLYGVEDDTLAKELGRLVTVQTSYHYRFDHESGRHDDRATVLAMGLVTCLEDIIPGGNHGPQPVESKPLPLLAGRSPVPVTRQSVDPVEGWNINGIGRRFDRR